MGKVTRRDILKLTGTLAGAGAVSGLLPDMARLSRTRTDLPSVIVLVLDAMSARHLSVYGYPRPTTPNFERFAERAVVFHRHYANASFTSPGTASLLTGQRPWTHRAFNPSGVVRSDLAERNVFNLLGEEYHKLAFTQNLWADYLLNQFSANIDTHLPISMFDLVGDGFIDRQLKSDALIANRSYASSLFPWSTRNPTSLVLSFLYNIINNRRARQLTPDDYPAGLPTNNTVDAFTLEDVFDGLFSEIAALEERQSPYFSYFHLWPPHDPYRPRAEFAKLFNRDGYAPVAKKQHPLSQDFSVDGLRIRRIPYDNFIAHIDSEFGRLVDALDERGVLEHTYLIVVSDHGEMFERGVRGHFTPLLYEPIIRVPLLVSVPGVRSRRDVFSPTSNVDILPTLLSIAGKEIPDWCEGKVLPGLGGEEEAGRSIIAMDAKDNHIGLPFTKATYAVIKGENKLIHYKGYRGQYNDFFEFYNLQEDPEELSNRYGKPKYSSIVDELKSILRGEEGAANRELL